MPTMEVREEQVVVVVAIRVRAECSLQKFNLRKEKSTNVAVSREPADLPRLHGTIQSSCIAVNSAMIGEVLKT